MAGPLNGMRVVEMAGIGPAPFACMLLSDLGAEVIRVDRVGDKGAAAQTADLLGRGRQSIALDVKQPEGLAVARALIDSADVLIEGFRPGVMEKLGLGPEACRSSNAKLVYARMTGWGQDGPLSESAGHDINYIAITGALEAIGKKESGPVLPLNLLGDFGGGSLYLIMGVLAAYISAKNTGRGQVVDCAITDGVISLMSFIQAFKAMGLWDLQRENNILDGGAHFYDTYECADGRHISVGAIEPQFFKLLIEKTGAEIDARNTLLQLDKSQWHEQKAILSTLFKTKTRQQWCELLEGSDACFAPVLNMDEAMEHPHNIARGNFVDINGMKQSAPAPRFSETPAEVQSPPVKIGENTLEILQELGIDARPLIDKGVINANS